MSSPAFVLSKLLVNPLQSLSPREPRNPDLTCQNAERPEDRPALAFRTEIRWRSTPKMFEWRTEMKRLIFALGMIGAGLCNHAALATAPTECFAKPAAVFAAHPNAAHVSYSLRVKKSERCWYADAFNAEAKAKAKPVPHPVATVAQTSTTPAPAITVPAPRPRTTAAAPVSSSAMMQFPGAGQPIQISVNARELSRLLPADEPTADFESRFSASGYRPPK
jgi:hypothetical protein